MGKVGHKPACLGPVCKLGVNPRLPAPPAMLRDRHCLSPPKQARCTRHRSSPTPIKRLSKAQGREMSPHPSGFVEPHPTQRVAGGLGLVFMENL